MHWAAGCVAERPNEGSVIQDIWPIHERVEPYLDIQLPAIMALSSPSSRSLDDKKPASDALVSELPEVKPEKTGKGLRFWLIFLALCVSLFLSALELVSSPRLSGMFLTE